MEENEFEDYDREAELALYREYRDVVGTFKTADIKLLNATGAAI